MGGGYFLYDTCDPDLLALDPLTHHPRVENTANDPLSHHPGVENAANPPRNQTAVGHIEVPPSPKPDYPANSGQYACGQERGGQAWLNIEAVSDRY